MFMRLVQLKIKPERLEELQHVYERAIIPALQQVDGCLFASLICAVNRDDECISMTLWQQPQQAETYEQSGRYAELLQYIADYLADSSEWRVHLSKDLTVQYEPVREEPVIKAFNVPGDKVTALKPGGNLYVRIVSPQIRPGKMAEFKAIYDSELLPALRQVPGCRYAAATQNVHEPDQVVSITVWNSKEDADHYEISGKFDALTDKVKHTFSEVYQWKMQLEKAGSNQVTTSGDLSVEGYSVVTGKSFL